MRKTFINTENMTYLQKRFLNFTADFNMQRYPRCLNASVLMTYTHVPVRAIMAYPYYHVSMSRAVLASALLTSFSITYNKNTGAIVYPLNLIYL